MNTPSKRPHVIVLGGNFAGLASAQHVRDYCGDKVDITLIDRRDYFLFVPNILTDVFENRNAGDKQVMELRPILKRDRVDFILGEVTAIDVDSSEVHFFPNERSGSEAETLHYDFLVIALGCRLSYDRIEGFAEYGHTVSDLYHGERLRKYLFDGDYKGGPIAIGSACFHQGDGAKDLVPYPGGSIPQSEAACEGPVLEIAMTLAHWLKQHKRGTPDLLTVFNTSRSDRRGRGIKQREEISRYRRQYGHSLQK